MKMEKGEKVIGAEKLKEWWRGLSLEVKAGIIVIAGAVGIFELGAALGNIDFGGSAEPNEGPKSGLVEAEGDDMLSTLARGDFYSHTDSNELSIPQEAFEGNILVNIRGGATEDMTYKGSYNFVVAKMENGNYKIIGGDESLSGKIISPGITLSGESLSFGVGIELSIDNDGGLVVNAVEGIIQSITIKKHESYNKSSRAPNNGNKYQTAFGGKKKRGPGGQLI